MTKSVTKNANGFVGNEFVPYNVNGNGRSKEKISEIDLPHGTSANGKCSDREIKKSCFCVKVYSGVPRETNSRSKIPVDGFPATRTKSLLLASGFA